jgi:hypothetical protein
MQAMLEPVRGYLLCSTDTHANGDTQVYCLTNTKVRGCNNIRSVTSMLVDNVMQLTTWCRPGRRRHASLNPARLLRNVMWLPRSRRARSTAPAPDAQRSRSDTRIASCARANEVRAAQALARSSAGAHMSLPVSTEARLTPNGSTPGRGRSCTSTLLHTPLAQSCTVCSASLRASGDWPLLVKELSSPVFGPAAQHGAPVADNVHVSWRQPAQRSLSGSPSPRRTASPDAPSHGRRRADTSLPHTPLHISAPQLMCHASRGQPQRVARQLRHGSMDVAVPPSEGILRAQESYRIRQIARHTALPGTRKSCPAHCRPVPEQPASSTCRLHFGADGAEDPCEQAMGAPRTLKDEYAKLKHEASAQVAEQSSHKAHTVDAATVQILAQEAACAPSLDDSSYSSGDHRDEGLKERAGLTSVHVSATSGGVKADNDAASDRATVCGESISSGSLSAGSKSECLMSQELVAIPSLSDAAMKHDAAACGSAASQPPGVDAYDGGQLGSVFSVDSSDDNEHCCDAVPPAHDVQDAGVPGVSGPACSAANAAMRNGNQHADTCSTPAVVVAASPADAAILTGASLEVHGGRGAHDSAAACTSSTSEGTSTMTLSPATVSLLQALQHNCARGALARSSAARASCVDCRHAILCNSRDTCLQRCCFSGMCHLSSTPALKHHNLLCKQIIHRVV